MIRVLLVLLVSTGAVAGPTFNRDIAPIIFQNCSSCHRPGQSAPFPLLRYEDAARHAKQIAEVTSKRLMPPWLPDPAYSHFEGERILTPEQIVLLRDWMIAGAPEGTGPAAEPPAFRESWALGNPDLILQGPRFDLPADGPDIYRNFVVPVPIGQTQNVAAIELDPGNRRVAHHAFIYLDRSRASRQLDGRDAMPGFEGMTVPVSAQSPDGHFLSWQPGKRFTWNPPGLSWRLFPESDLVLQLHLQPSGKPEVIQSSIAFYFTNQPPTRFPLKLVLTSFNIDIPVGETNYVVTNSFRVPVDLDVLAVLPHAHYLGKDLQGYVLLPDGRTNWLIRIPDWNFNWQGDYRFQHPVYAPRGSTLVMRFQYDNSTNNPHNPQHPPVRVGYGPQTRDEMAELWLQTLPHNPGDMAALRREMEKQTLQFAIEFAEATLKRKPDDARAHLHYGQALLAQGKRRRALPHFTAAARADPSADEPHYYLGLLARMDQQPEIAIQHFNDALRLNPRNAKAYGNLGLIYVEKHELANAEKSFLAALALEPRDSIAHDQLGVIYLDEGKYADAEAHFREAALAQPDDPEIKERLALASKKRAAQQRAN